ncbi:MAG: hypothetical protein V7637_776 [Mycobacteriales bacterium]
MPSRLTTSITPTAPMNFTTNGLPLAPFYVADANAYHVYFNRANRAPAAGSGAAGPADLTAG